MPENKAETKSNIFDQFAEDIEKLIKKHDIQKYVGVFYFSEESDKSILLHKAEDIMEVTRIFKIAHNNCKNEVARRIGESN